jgi:hypothetical protein
MLIWNRLLFGTLDTDLRDDVQGWQKQLENHDIYYIGAAELPLRFTYCAPLLGWRYL